MVAVKIVTHDRTLATLAETLRESALSTSIQHPNVVCLMPSWRAAVSPDRLQLLKPCDHLTSRASPSLQGGCERITAAALFTTSLIQHPRPMRLGSCEAHPMGGSHVCLQNFDLLLHHHGETFWAQNGPKQQASPALM